MDILYVIAPWGSNLVEYAERIEGAIALVCCIRPSPCGRFIVVATTDRTQAILFLEEDGFDREDIL